MNTITIAISDERLVKLQKAAVELNLSIEYLLLMSLENLLTQRENHTTNPIKNTEIDPEIVNKFYALAQQWENEVAGMSSTAQMSQHPNYQEIIRMGEKVVPLLLLELRKNPLYWLTALSTITGENPIKAEQRGRVKQMASAWIEWGRNHGYAIEENV
ncbi:MAG TPA: hypothetical protein V6D28_19070 [Leptolyngbyaceae cyanobacterium]